MTRQVNAGGLLIGGGAPVSIQSMTNTKTGDASATLAQIMALAGAGCQLVRVAANDKAAAAALPALAAQSPVPLCADVHFDVNMAVAALEAGFAKVRINPGNLGGPDKVRRLCHCLRAHHAPVRVGVNGGSLEKGLLTRYGGPTARALVESALGHAGLLEREGFTDIVLSMKSSSVRTTVEAARLARKHCDYPLHIGVTEAGGGELARIKSAAGIGALLLEGIGDTIRVSLTGDPMDEVQEARSILRALGIRRDFVEVISCPTCGRTAIDVAGIAARVREATRDIPRPLKVAVMGCVVNGPGEAREADLGIAGGGDGSGVLLRKGRPPRKVEGDLFQILMDEIREVLR